ncbi:MAG TPA: hypothetical protein VMK65_11790 [Longimicrobiales bacterium]|nr:hypothetical protein [Longimicrobiales bacterium]
MPSTTSTIDTDCTITAVDPEVSVTLTPRTGTGLGITTIVLNTPLAGTAPLVSGAGLTVRIQ